MKRPGFTLIEISAAIALLAVCALLFVHLASLTAAERVRERTRQTAVDQMQNILERLATVPPEKFIAGDFDKIAAERLIERSLPEGALLFEVKKIEPDSIVLTLTASWSEGEKRPRMEAALFRLLTL